MKVKNLKLFRRSNVCLPGLQLLMVEPFRGKVKHLLLMALKRPSGWSPDTHCTEMVRVLAWRPFRSFPAVISFPAERFRTLMSCGLFSSVFITFSFWAFCFVTIMIASVSSSRASSCQTPFGTAAGVDFSFHAEVQVRPRRRPVPPYTSVTSISGRLSWSNGAFSSSWLSRV